MHCVVPAEKRHLFLARRLRSRGRAADAPATAAVPTVAAPPRPARWVAAAPDHGAAPPSPIHLAASVAWSGSTRRCHRPRHRHSVLRSACQAPTVDEVRGHCVSGNSASPSAHVGKSDLYRRSAATAASLARRSRHRLRASLRSRATVGCCGNRCVGSGNGPSHNSNRLGGFHRRLKGMPAQDSAASAARELRTKNHEQPAATNSVRIFFCAALATPRELFSSTKTGGKPRAMTIRSGRPDRTPRRRANRPPSMERGAFSNDDQNTQEGSMCLCIKEASRTCVSHSSRRFLRRCPIANDRAAARPDPPSIPLTAVTSYLMRSRRLRYRLRDRSCYLC